MDLKSEFVWSTPEGKPTAAALTQGTFVIKNDDIIIWGNEKFEWTWIEVLEWLNYNWSIVNRPKDFSENEDFIYQHNFSNALNGASAPQLIIWRSEDAGFLKNDAGTVVVPVKEWEELFAEISNKVKERLVESSDPRAEFAIANIALN